MRSYAICYDCGYGYKGYHERYLSYDGVLEWLKDRDYVDLLHDFIDNPSELNEAGALSKLFVMPMSSYDEEEWESGDPLDV